MRRVKGPRARVVSNWQRTPPDKEFNISNFWALLYGACWIGGIIFLLLWKPLFGFYVLLAFFSIAAG
jgi:hypothetical protein